MKKYVIGVDVGGTNVEFGLVNSHGRIIARSHFNTKFFIQNKKKLIAALIRSIEDIILGNRLKKKDISGIGIGLPGLIDPKNGIVKLLPNIPHWKNVPLKKILQDKLRISTFMDNDVNLITLGEWKYGAGIGVKNMICMTLGTGIGGGLILNNALYRGEGYVAGELGHMPLNETGPTCPCQGFACFERYVGNKELLKKLKKIFKRNDISIPLASQLAAQGNKKAIKFWEETATHIGNGLVGVVNLLNPSLIVIGGGVSHNEKYLFKTIRTIIQKRAMPVQSKMVKIVRSILGSDAGIIGAQVLIKDARS